MLYHLIFLLCISQFTHGELCTDSVCEYDFTVRHVRTMTYFKPDETYTSIAYNVEMDGYRMKVAPNTLRLNGSDSLIGTYVSADDVITGDGFSRNVAVINDKFPGPTIEVMEGAQVVVRVWNHLLYEGISFHWHGVTVKNTPWMDGVSYITQCPILPRQRFTYRFKAQPAGTHWYHAHFRSMKTDGAFGLLKIHKAVPSIPSSPLFVEDWFHHDANTLEILNPWAVNFRGTGEMHLTGPERDHSIDGVQTGAISHDKYNIIANGRGRYLASMLTPYERFEVTRGQVHKFHLVNVGTEYNLEVSIDNHHLQVVASDGFDINPVKVTSIIVGHGEVIDFTVDLNQAPGLYWMRIKTIRAGKSLDVILDGEIGPEGYAIVHYSASAAGDYDEPTSTRRVCTVDNPCTAFNCPFRGYRLSDYTTCVGFGDVTSTLSKARLDADFGVSDTNYEEMFLTFNFAVGSGVNGRKFSTPTAPLFQGQTDNINACDEEDCKDGCFCTQIVTLPYNKTIQMVLSNIEPGQSTFSHHPIHMHGHSFAVLKVGYPTYNETTGHWIEPNQEVTCIDKYCAPAAWSNGVPDDLNTENPPIKDTLIIPARGYAVIRIRTDNPGWWFMHCHTEQHIMDGMGLVLYEAVDHIPPLPKDFPKCHDFQFTADNYEKFQRRDFSGSEESQTTTAPCPNEAPTTRRTSDNNGGTNVADSDEENLVTLSLATFTGAAIGFILFGVVLTVFPLCLYHQCVTKRQEKQYMGNGPHVNRGYSTS